MLVANKRLFFLTDKKGVIKPDLGFRWKLDSEKKWKLKHWSPLLKWASCSVWVGRWKLKTLWCHAVRWGNQRHQLHRCFRRSHSLNPAISKKKKIAYDWRGRLVSTSLGNMPKTTEHTNIVTVNKKQHLKKKRETVIHPSCQPWTWKLWEIHFCILVNLTS